MASRAANSLRRRDDQDIAAAPRGLGSTAEAPASANRSAWLLRVRPDRAHRPEVANTDATDIADAAGREPSSLALELALIFLIVAGSFVNLAFVLVG